jgi:hypothetical protein
MSTSIHGIVEAQSWADAQLWLPVVDAGFILRQDYGAFARLFGVRNSLGAVPFAQARGFPKDFSGTDVLDLFQKQANPYLDGDVFCYSPSWLGWDEMQRIDWSPYDLDWKLLFNLMKSLSEFPDFSDLRLVVWFDN